MPQNRQDLRVVLVAAGSAHTGRYDELGTPSRVCRAFAHVAGVGSFTLPVERKKKKYDLNKAVQLSIFLLLNVHLHWFVQ